MERPSFLDHRPPQSAEDILSATGISVLSAFVEEGVLLTSELGYGFEDIPMVADLVGHLRDAVIETHPPAPAPWDFRLLQTAFVQAFALGLDLASQMRDEGDDTLRLDLDAIRLVDSDAPFLVESPLADAFARWHPALENIFVSVQNRTLAAPASTQDRALLLDFHASACLWSCLSGIEAGLCQLEGSSGT